MSAKFPMCQDANPGTTQPVHVVSLPNHPWQRILGGFHIQEIDDQLVECVRLIVVGQMARLL